jgi:putative hemolysin
MSLLPLAVLFLVIASAMLAASETALFALARMEHTREQLGREVQLALTRLMRRPLESLVVVIGLSEACNVFAECLATTFLLTLLGPPGAYVAAPLMLLVVLMFCDITPKTFALGFPAGIAGITARPLAELADLVHPIARHFAPTAPPARPTVVTEAEFKALLKLGEHHGAVEPGERAMIHRVFDFGARRAAEVMSPRERIFSVDIDLAPALLIAEVSHRNFSRVPVWRGTPDNIIGILHTKDLAARRLEPQPPRIDRLVRPAYFVPPGKPLGDLFDEMRRGRFQLALVVNEYGKLLGLVTLEDLLEELFGEIRDEFELEVPELTQSADGAWLASGAIAVDQLAKAIGATEPLANAVGGGRTLGALILRRLGRVPRAGETVQLGEFVATVERVRGATVETVRVAR